MVSINDADPPTTVQHMRSEGSFHWSSQFVAATNKQDTTMLLVDARQMLESEMAVLSRPPNIAYERSIKEEEDIKFTFHFTMLASLFAAYGFACGVAMSRSHRTDHSFGYIRRRSCGCLYAQSAQSS